MESTTTISTYHEYINEAILALRNGLHIYNHDIEENILELGDHPIIPIDGVLFCRYAFLMISNSIEAAANALIFTLQKDKSLYNELERMNTLAKFEIFCEFLGKTIPKGDVRYMRLNEIIKCRNEFVHPKPRIVGYSVDDNTSELTFDVKKTSDRQYPYYFADIYPKHVITALDDTLNFISWVCFDICKFDIIDGSLRLGINSYGSCGDIIMLEGLYNLRFDKRSFGYKPDPKH